MVVTTRSRKLGGSASAVLDYLSDEIEDVLGYYAEKEEGRVFSECWGSLAVELGLEQGITREQFTELFNGRWEGEQVCRSGYRKTIDPATGEEVTESARTPMIDVVYATPKSVAEYMVTASPQTRQQISQATLRATKAAFEAMESSARVARVSVKTPTMVGPRTTKTQGSATERVLADLICTPVVQFTARPTEATVSRGAPPDPHLHVHAPIFTACQVDGRWLTADEYAIKSPMNVEYRDAVFMGTLALELEKMGIEIDYDTFDDTRSGRVSWEIKGSNPDARRFWSSNNARSWEIRMEFEARYGRPMTDDELTNALRATRGKKTAADKAQDTAPVWELWADDAEANGIKLRRSEPSRIPLLRQPVQLRRRELARRVMSSKGLTRQDAVFTGEEIRPTLARCAVGLGFSPEDLDHLEPQLRDALVPVRVTGDDRFSYFTTKEMLAQEKAVTSGLARKARHAGARPDSSAIRWAIDHAPVPLDPEQQQAIRAACSGRALVHWAGRAGSGKTQAAKVVVRANRLSNSVDTVFVVSTAAQTAERTGRKVDADRWGSIESFVHQVRHGFQPTNKTLIVADESAMIDTPKMAELLKHSGEARLLLIGDSAQLSPIGAGGWYDESIDRHGASTLATVYRQRDARDASDYGRLRYGKQVAQAVKNLTARGRVHMSDDRVSRMADVFSDYRDFRDQGYSAAEIRVVSEGSNHDIDTANRFIQRDRQRRGEIPDEGFVVEDTQQGRRWIVHEGDQVVFLRSYRRHGQKAVKNGAEGTILSLDLDSGKAQVGLEDKGIVTVQLASEEDTQPLGLRYAMHAQRLQGGEVPIVQVMPGTPFTSTANSAYSETTRAQHESHVYLDYEDHPEGVESLIEAWSVPVVKKTATRYITEAKAQDQGPKTREIPGRSLGERDLGRRDLGQSRGGFGY